MKSVAAEESRGRRLRVRLPADPRRLRALRRQVGEWATEQSVPPDAVLDLQLVVSEAVSNGVEHAYRGRRPGTVEVELELRDEPGSGEQVIAVVVVDHGEWRPIPMHKGGRGRGLAIIHQLSRGLRISASDAGTRLSCLVPASG